MKKLLIIALAATTLFAACSKDGGGGNPALPEGTHSLTVKASVPGMGESRADTGTAVGKTPAIDAMTLVFVKDGIVDKLHTATVATITTTGETVSGISTGTVSNSIYVFGGNTDVPVNPAVAALVPATSTEAQVKAILYDMANQATGEDATKVSTRGYSTYTVVSGGTAAANLEVVPAVSRIEIKTVEAKTTPTDPADQVQSFDLEGIYINNTFKKIGADYTVYPTAAGDIVNYDSENVIWASGYDARYHDAFTTNTGAATYSAADFWSYYTAPAQQQSGASYVGTKIPEGGVAVQYLAVPHIVCKLNNVMVGASAPGTLQANPNTAGQWKGTNTLFVRVTKYKTTGGVDINYFEPGKVYQIEKISFDATNLHSNPVPKPEDKHNVIATVVVKNWEGVVTDPVLD